MAGTVCSAVAWGKRNFEAADLGDLRRTRRLVKVATALAETSQGTLPGAFATWAELKAAYRLFADKDVTYEKIISPHWENTREHCRKPGEYMFIEDTTLLDFSAHAAVEGMGQVGNDNGKGLNLHTTLALRIEGWNDAQEPEVSVQGVLGQRCWARQGKPNKGRERKGQRLQRARESERWAAVLSQIGGIPQGTKWTYMGDRESDVYEVLGKCLLAGVDLIIRAAQPRALQNEGLSVFEAVADSCLKGTFSVPIRARPRQTERIANIQVRATTVTLRPPQRPGGRSEPVTLNVVEAREVRPPKGCDSVHWVLLTSWAVETFEQALRVVKAYSKRWLIEEYHKALKTGANIERSQLSDAERILALLGILAVVAVRLLETKLLATTKPTERVRADQVGPEALAILEARFGKPRGGWTHQRFFVSVARLGGFLARKSDGSPGWLTIWRGWQRLMTLVEGYKLARGEE